MQQNCLSVSRVRIMLNAMQKCPRHASSILVSLLEFGCTWTPSSSHAVIAISTLIGKLFLRLVCISRFPALLVLFSGIGCFAGYEWVQGHRASEAQHQFRRVRSEAGAGECRRWESFDRCVDACCDELEPGGEEAQIVCRRCRSCCR